LIISAIFIICLAVFSSIELSRGGAVLFLFDLALPAELLRLCPELDGGEVDLDWSMFFILAASMKLPLLNVPYES
jgi:hypothetical protein